MSEEGSLKERSIEQLCNSDLGSSEPATQSKVSPVLKVYVPIPYQKELVWPKVIGLIVFHILGLWGLFLFPEIKWQTNVFTLILGTLTSMSILAGTHRLWSHRSYTANLGLRLVLLFFFTMGFQSSVHEWVRDHRGHHKWSDTDADPYNASRGFFFSHVGWIALKKHPEVLRKGKTIDMSDIEGDPLLMFQKRWYGTLVLLIWGLLPTLIPVYFWDERLLYSLLVCVFFRTIETLNSTWLVNSWAHMFGYRPYDKRIAPVEATIRHLMLGEGFHNYHHAFPWDYSASELGPFHVFNPATAFIDFCHWMGWASNLKRANDSLVQKKVNSVGEIDTQLKCNFVGEWIGGLFSYVLVYGLGPLAISQLLRASLRVCFGLAV